MELAMSKPHTKVGVIGAASRPTLPAPLLLGQCLGGPIATEGETSFCRLSEEAQNLIIGALLGDYDKLGPPEIPESVKNEIAHWVAEP